MYISFDVFAHNQESKRVEFRWLLQRFFLSINNWRLTTSPCCGPLGWFRGFEITKLHCMEVHDNIGSFKSEWNLCVFNLGMIMKRVKTYLISKHVLSLQRRAMHSYT